MGDGGARGGSPWPGSPLNYFYDGEGGPDEVHIIFIPQNVLVP